MSKCVTAEEAQSIAGHLRLYSEPGIIGDLAALRVRWTPKHPADSPEKSGIVIETMVQTCYGNNGPEYDLAMFLVALDDDTLAEVPATDCKIVRGGA